MTLTIEPPAAKTGNLAYAGHHPLCRESLPWYRCVDCGTDFPAFPNATPPTGSTMVMCNGQAIDKCPWCRPDSVPCTLGRER